MLKICIAPLDWGLGHAGRMIPIIKELDKQNHDVFIAGAEEVIRFLKYEFPNLTYIPIPAYKPKYGSRLPLELEMAKQSHHFLKIIKEETEIANALTEKWKFDFIISDNRYGFRSTKCKNIFITHQLQILMPGYLKFLENFLNRLNHSYINKFDECWIPDFEKTENLSGKLSHNIELDIPQFYIGPLSRFSDTKNNQLQATGSKEILAICSGPEPGRSKFKNILLKQLSQLEEPNVLIGGDLNAVKQSKKYGNCTYYPFLSPTELIIFFKNANIIISRSGYTTVMDLFFLQKKAIFIPTKGQTEQEYLATKFRKENICPSYDLHKFNVRNALAESSNFKGFEEYSNIQPCVRGSLKKHIELRLTSK
ncbi:MAG: glycosyltransferase [Chitinophagaceae bacterium]|nr:MAG: glycosyltransferase [Chitinophagaceae bacterium]